MNPSSFTIFKAKSAIELRPALRDEKEEYPKPGGVFMSIKGMADDPSKKYDWKGGITFFLAANEISLFNSFLKEGQGKMYHDAGKGTEDEGKKAKSLLIAKGENGCFVNLNMGSNKQSIFLNPHEIDTITTLLNSVLPKLYGWV